jgi:hypothetical protein
VTDEYVERVQALMSDHPWVLVIGILVVMVMLVARVFSSAAR